MPDVKMPELYLHTLMYLQIVCFSVKIVGTKFCPVVEMIHDVNTKSLYRTFFVFRQRFSAPVLLPAHKPV